MPRRFLLDHRRWAQGASRAAGAVIASSLVIVVCPLCFGLPAQATPERWWPGFAPPGPGGTVQTIISHDGELIVGGSFASMGALPVSNIARWNGTDWRAFGEGADNRVLASIIYNGEPIVAGEFTSIDGAPANRIARWNGHHWFRLGDGLDGAVTSLAIYDGELYAAGDFGHAGGVEVVSIARWNGIAWASTGFAAPQWFPEHAAFTNLIVHDGALIGVWMGVPGEDELYGWQTFFARWDGATWAIGDSSDIPHRNRIMPTSLAIHGGDLYAAGLWTDGYDENARVARLVDGEWLPIGPAFPDYDLLLTSYAGRLIVAQGTGGGNRGGSFLSEWTGLEWRRLDTGPVGPVNAFGQHEGELIAGGAFGFADGPRVHGLAGWNGERWRSYGEFPGMGCDNGIDAIGASADRVVTAGSFRFAGPLPAAGGASWTGAEWQAIPASQPYTGLGYSTSRIEVLGAEIYANGNDQSCGNHICYMLDRWREGNWEHLAAFNDRIHALHAANGRVYVGGAYYRVGNQPASRIAVWDGSAWSPLATGLDGTVFDITSFHGQIVVGGVFDGTDGGGTAAPRVALWDGVRWQALGEGPGFPVLAVVEHAGGLVAAGATSVQHSATSYGISRWDGSSWSPLGDPPDDSVLRLAVYRGRLIAGGTFTHFGDAEIHNLAEWTGQRWIPFGGGTSGRVTGLAPRGDELFVVGHFAQVGETPSWSIARWSESLAAPAEFRVAPDGDNAVVTWTLPDDPDVIGVSVRFAEGDFPTGAEGGEPLPGGLYGGFFPGAPGSQGQVVHSQPGDGGLTCYAAYAIASDGRRSVPIYGSFRRVDRIPPELRVRTVRRLFFGVGIVVELNASEPLDSARAEIHIDGDRLPMRSVDETALHWLAVVRAPVSGIPVRFDVCGSDLAGNAACKTLYVSGLRFPFGEGGKLTSPDGRLTLDLQFAPLQSDEVVSIVWDPEDAAGPRVYQIGPQDGLDAGPAMLEYRYADDAIGGADPRRLGIEDLRTGPIASFVDPGRQTVTGRVEEFGTFRVALGDQIASELADAGYLRLDPPHPNPVVTVGYLSFELRDRIDATVTVIDVTGRRVARLFSGLAGPGRQVVTWDGWTDAGTSAPSGIYFVRVATPRAWAVERMIRVR